MFSQKKKKKLRYNQSQCNTEARLCPLRCSIPSLGLSFSRLSHFSKMATGASKKEGRQRAVGDLQEKSESLTHLPRTHLISTYMSIITI